MFINFQKYNITEMRRYREAAKDKDFPLKLEIYAMAGLPTDEESIYCNLGSDYPSTEKTRSMIHLESLEPSQNINRRAQISDDAHETFSVLSYNIHSRLPVMGNNSSTTYKNCKALPINWAYRLLNLLPEITNYNADIICPQEVNFYVSLFHRYVLSGLCYSSNDLGRVLWNISFHNTHTP